MADPHRPATPPAPAADQRPAGPDVPGVQSGDEDPGAALDDPEMREAMRGEREKSGGARALPPANHPPDVAPPAGPGGAT
ncbi:MAG: hypothetical protein ABIX46_14310 [Burkholderiaceae bacterium]